MSDRVLCTLCPHKCAIAEGKNGLCKARGNRDGEIVSLAYGKLTSVALDPIEKKPLADYCRGSMILSVGSFGCNMACCFCQNWQISQDITANTVELSPKKLIEEAVALKARENIGIAYTYNEPLVNYEYVYDCAVLAHDAGLKNVLVTNGMICEEPFDRLLPYLDAANIDLKAFSHDFYLREGGDLDTVKNNIRTAASRIHLEVTTLVIEGLNDDTTVLEAEFQWLAEINPEIPLHLSRFFPNYKLTNRPPTRRERMFELEALAHKYLSSVYLGNMY